MAIDAQIDELRQQQPDVPLRQQFDALEQLMAGRQLSELTPDELKAWKSGHEKSKETMALYDKLMAKMNEFGVVYAHIELVAPPAIVEAANAFMAVSTERAGYAGELTPEQKEEAYDERRTIFVKAVRDKLGVIAD